MKKKKIKFNCLSQARNQRCVSTIKITFLALAALNQHDGIMWLHCVYFNALIFIGPSLTYRMASINFSHLMDACIKKTPVEVLLACMKNERSQFPVMIIEKYWKWPREMCWIPVITFELFFFGDFFDVWKFLIDKKKQVWALTHMRKIRVKKSFKFNLKPPHDIQFYF